MTQRFSWRHVDVMDMDMDMDIDIDIDMDMDINMDIDIDIDIDRDIDISQDYPKDILTQVHEASCQEGSLHHHLWRYS